MQRALAELAVAAAVIALALAAAPALDGGPGAAAPHALGVVGTLLMLWAEVGHSVRRSRRHTLQPARWSLSAHVVAGLVGPALVILHAGGRSAGLAGVVAAMTVAVVASGVTGRLLYPAAVRTRGLRPVVAAWHVVHVPLATATVALAAVHVGAALWFGAGVR